MEALKARSYQLEMLDQSLQENIILAMDTGSGKTYVASMRIMAELQRCNEHQIVWFLTPTVALAMQQKEAIGSHLPAINIRLLTGQDGVERWGDQQTWDAALRGMRLVISTHAVLADALTHGFVKITQVALLVLDEAHHCVKNHPGNRIMQDFYHPTRVTQGVHAVPHILGLTASPIMRSTVADITKIETNLNAISRTPRLERRELMKLLYRPRLSLIYYSEPNAAQESRWTPFLQALRRLVSTSEHASGADPKHVETLARLCSKAEKVGTLLGEWAADHFVMYTMQCVVSRRIRNGEDLWVDSGMVHLAIQMQAILAADQVQLGRDDVLSNKSEGLLSFLVKEHHEGFSGIVFVQERAVAYALSAVIAHHPLTRELFCCEPCVGSTYRGTKQNIWEILGSGDVEGTLLRFKERRCNLIVATDVLEEGIDLAACHLVVCFDPPSNVKSFIQRRGRARQQQSTFAIMISDTETPNAVAGWQHLENEMIRRYQDHGRMLEDIEELEERSENVPFQMRLPTGALLTGQTAISHLYHFCNTMPSEPYVELYPRFKFERRDELLHATVVLPCVIDPSLRVAKGTRWWLTEHAAKRDAAFHAYVSLYNAGLVNENLLPLHRTIHCLTSADEEDTVPPKIQAPNVDSPWTPNPVPSGLAKVHRCLVSVRQNGIDRPDLSIILVCFVKIPPTKSLTLYWDSKTTFTISLRDLDLSTVSETQLSVMREVTYLYLSSARTARLQFEDKADYAVMVSPDVPIRRLSTWLNANQGSRSCLDQYMDDSQTAPQGFIRSESLYNRPYRFTRWTCSNEGSEVLVECQPFPKRRNMLYGATLAPGGLEMSQLSLDSERNSTKVKIPANSCTCDILPWEISRSSLFLAPVIQHLQRHLVAARLQENILPSYPTIELETLADAITAPSAQWTSDYQRLEFLGDGLLKFIICVQLFHRHPLWPESYPSRRKSHIVSNNYLTNAALRVGLQRFVLVEPLTSRRWMMPTISQIFKSSTAQRELSSKTLADVLESMVGAAFVHGGIPSAWSMVHDLLTCVPKAMPSLLCQEPLGKDLVVGPNFEGYVSQLVGYRFNNCFIMWEALTHPSWQRDFSTSSYQRLEFLGDAVLDMVVTKILCECSSRLTEGDMSQIKAALVNRHFLAFLCMQLSIEEGFVEIREARTGSFDQVAGKRSRKLWEFMRHDNPDISVAQQSCLGRYTRLCGHIQQQLTSGTRHPWAALTQIGANKFYSDIMESLLAGIFIDSSGIMDRCEEFLHHIGLTVYLQRILQARVDVTHPRAILSKCMGSKRIRYHISPSTNPSALYNIAVSVEGKELAYVTGCLSKDECIVRGADLAIQNLGL